MTKLWIARDANGVDYIFKNKPVKDEQGGFWFDKDWYTELDLVDVEILIGREISWEDDEPVLIEVKEIKE